MNHPDLLSYFIADHRRCDTTWAELETAADQESSDATAKWTAFKAAMEGNLRREEEVLFPAFESETGMTQGPTTVMRAEHEQMRAIMRQMEMNASTGNWEGIVDHGDTLMMLIQQHNMKEEGMLLPMASQALCESWPAMQKQLS